MWVVAKIKNNHSKIFQQALSRKAKDKIIFYEPKIIYEKFLHRKNIKKQKPLLENYIYILTPRGLAEKAKLTMNFMKRKMQEYDELKKEIKK